MSTSEPAGPPEPPGATPRGGRRFDPQIVVMVVLAVYVAVVVLLSPDLPAAVARSFGIKPTEALAALIVVPGLAAIIVRVLIARN